MLTCDHSPQEAGRPYSECVMLRVLGPLEAEGPDGPVPVGGPVPRRVLCALLVRPGAVVPVDSPCSTCTRGRMAATTSWQPTSRLREALAGVGGAVPPKLEHRAAATAGGRARGKSTRSGSSRPSSRPTILRVEAATELREALAAWRPPAPFADLQDTAYPSAEAARLTELRGSAGEGLVSASSRVMTRSPPGRGWARLRDDPYRERLWELLVLALYRQGRQGDALEARRRARAGASDGSGVDPGPRLRELEAQVCRPARSLDTAGGPVSRRRASRDPGRELAPRAREPRSGIHAEPVAQLGSGPPVRLSASP